jgi:hypothetical protein
MTPAVNEIRASEYLGTAVQTLRNWRNQRRGPAYVKLGRSVRYLVKDLESYLMKNRIDPGKRE